ncbi:YhcH/YjgK/YiaL family protein [Azotosporobacter soli]|uniref:YhcH/YjgK/YiaL family protein n=1 Tax=Azotosporobacter soli TaxID=3055040 RepID=UPI0031FED65D
MIFGVLHELERDRQWLPAALVTGLDYLARTDLAALPLGKHLIQGEDIFVSVSEYETEPWKDKRPEAHQRYLDIQCLGRGVEIIGWRPAGDDLVVEEDRLAEADLLFFRPPTGESEILLESDRYGIFWPGEVHRPGCALTEPLKVKKIVVKVAAKLLCR